mgnify:FL=1
MKVLVTGRNGQLGSEIHSISEQYDNFEFIFTSSLNLDISNEEAVFSFFNNHQFDAVINCAAYTAVDKAEDELENANAVNHLGVQYIVENCEQKNIRLIHISTDYVFDGSNNVAYKETDPVSPIGVYGKTKRLGEEVILNSSLNAIIIRTSWVYSTFGNNFVKTMIRLGKEKDELGVIVDQVGTPTNTNDLASACLTILSEANNWNQKVSIYHYSNNGVTSWYDFATEIMTIANLDCKVNPIESFEYPTKALRPNYSVLNKRKIVQDFDLKIPHWKESLVKMIKQF